MSVIPTNRNEVTFDILIPVCCSFEK
jgi:hypothetical protein